MAETGTPQRLAGTRPTRPAPDFSALALQHLGQRCDAFRQHVREHLERPGADAPLERLDDDLRRFRNTLVLLERTGAVFVAEELLELLARRTAGEIDDEDEFARVLVAAGERLGDHVARLERNAGDDRDGALGLLPLVNDSRACRDAPLLSEAIVAAAGIELPAADARAPDDAPARETFLGRVRECRSALMAGLLDWFRTTPGEASGTLGPVIEAFEELSALAAVPSLAHVAPTLDAAAVLAGAIAGGEVADGTAPRRLFGQLERWLQSVADTPERLAEPPPEELQRNVLYYVALVAPATPRAAALHERFGLERVRPSSANAAERVGGASAAALGTRLSRAIRDSLDVETSGLRQWLEQAPTAADHPHVLRLRTRLAHVEPVLTLLGAREARTWLRRINETLGALSGDAPVGATERLMLAESLIRLDRALDAAAGGGRGAGAASGDGSAAATGEAADGDSATRLAIEEAVTACLEEARRRLLLVGESLDAPRLVGASGDAELELIERALTVLALPDVGPLLRGLRAANARIDGGAPPAVRETLATLIASLEFYLGCVLNADAGSRRLLHDAEEALARLEARLPPVAVHPGVVLHEAGSPAGGATSDGGVPGSRPETERDVDDAPAARPAADANLSFEGDAEIDEAGEVSTAAALGCMDRIGEALAGRRGDEVSVGALRGPFDALADIAARGGIDGMRELASAAVRLLERVAHARGGDEAPLSDDELALLEEAHAVLPQLIEQVHGSSEEVRGLDTLVQDLRGAEPAPLPPRPAPAFGDDSFDDSGALTLDNTLQQVFYRECATHIDTLERAVAQAERADDDAERLPSDAMLRALHTLSGSAQTVDAHHIVAVVQPLQRVALARQRSDLPFDEAETRYVGELVDVLRARLAALESGAPVAPFVADVERRLDDFVDAALAAERRGDAAARRSLDSVFDEEARELLARLSQALADEHDAAGGTDRALGHLHTLKGSARMAGRHALAERAHALEGLVQGMPSSEARRRALIGGRRELQTLLLDTMPHGALPFAPEEDRDARRATPDDVVPGRVETGGGSDGEGAPAPSVADGAALAREAAGTAPSVRQGARALPGTTPEERDTASVPAATFENLLSLATDVTVSQARLSDDIARVREICRDLESAAGRWRQLPHEAPLLESPAAREMLADLETARRGLNDALRLADVEQQHASRAASSLQQTLIRTRLVRVESLRERLAETLEDAAEACGRSARLVVDGGEVTLDGALCRQLRAPLEHLVRNAVVHGIEAPEARRAAGKEPTGTVRLVAAIDGTEIVLTVEDDGGGIDRDAVSRRREAKGGDAVDTVDALQDVLCEPGFTTLDSASAVGGRGLGLSAVSETLARLDGRLHIGTRAGRGTSVTCRLRQRIIVNQVVLVRSARRLYALPVNVVRRVGGEDGAASSAAAGGRDGAEAGTPLAAPRPRHSLLALLGGVAPPSGREEGETDDTGAYAEGSAELEVEVGGRAFTLEVDRVLGYRELLTQPLGPQLAALRRYAGGSVLPDGRQVLVVELDRLIGEGGAGPLAAARRARPDPETMRPVALVVDDSITMRVAAAGMLAQHGVESREARDGIEALDSLARALPDLMIVDLDMPRLGGFDLIRRARERFGERAPPVIVISSRDGEEDREHAAALGVVRYLTKPYTERELHDALLASGLRLPDLTIA